jgi:hypothetical protein
MRYPVANLGRPSLGVVSADPCAGETGLLARYNCQNNALKNALNRLGPLPPPFVPPPPTPPPPTPFRYPGEGNIPMSVATGGIPSAPGETPGVSPNPPPPPPGPVRPDVASVDRFIKPDEPEPTPPPPPEPPLQPPISVRTELTPMSVATGGVPGATPPPLPPPTDVPKCYSCGGKAVLLTSAQAAAQGCAQQQIDESGCRPPVATPGSQYQEYVACRQCPDGSFKRMNTLDAEAAGCKAVSEEQCSPGMTAMQPTISPGLVDVATGAFGGGLTSAAMFAGGETATAASGISLMGRTRYPVANLGRRFGAR